MIAAAALLLATAIGYLAVRLVRPAGDLGPRWAAILLETALGIGAGAAITSTIFLLLLAAGAASRVTQLFAEAAVLVALLVWVRIRFSERQAAGTTTHADFHQKWVMGIALGLALALVAAAQVSTARADPWGQWDAFAIWNLRAKFLVSGGEMWTRAASPLLEATHWDYPLLLSLFVGRTWMIDGDIQSPAAGFGVAILFFWAVVALLVSGLSLTRGVAAGLLAALIVIATTSFLEHGTWQYADIPLAFFCLATLVLVSLGTSASSGRYSVLALAGAAAGMAAWTKNEGLVFLVAALTCHTVITWRHAGQQEALRRFRWWIAGAAPGLVLLGWFHLGLATGGDTLPSQTLSQALSKLADPGRYAQILGSALSDGIGLGVGIMHPLLLLLVLALLLQFHIEDRDRSVLWFGAATLALMVAAYFTVFLITTDDLQWRLATAMDRLYTQVWPAFLFLAFLMLRPPESARTTGEEGKAPKAKRKKKTSSRRGR